MNNKLNTKTLLKTYFGIFAVSSVLFFIMLALTDGQSFHHTLFRNTVGTDFFMDFFNSIRDASTKEVYKEGIIYPPLANIFFYVLSLMIDPKLAATSFSKRTLLQRDYVCLFIYFVFVILCLLLFSSIIKRYFAKYGFDKYSSALSVLLIFSYPMIYCVQRGNVALLSLVFSMFFVFNRNNENKLIKELSFILLAIAAGIKLYPAAFGLLLLTDKKYKDAIRLVIYGIICIILPFFFYDGFESIGDLVDNLNEFSDFSLNKLSPEFVCIDLLALYANTLFGVGYYSAYAFLATATYLSALAIFIVSDKEWQKIWAVVYMIMNYPSTARTYILVFAIIPFIIFLCSKSFRKRDIPYFISFLLLIVVIPPLYITKISDILDLTEGISGLNQLMHFINDYLASPNQLLSAFIVTCITLYMFADTLISITRGEIQLPRIKLKTKKK